MKTGTTILFSLALLFIALGMAQPRIEIKQSEESKTLNAVIVLDISVSMQANDGPNGKTRLGTGISAIERLLDTYPDGRFGLIVYTDVPQVFALTNDHQALKTLMWDIRDNYEVRGEGSKHLWALQETGKLINESVYETDTVFFISDGDRSLEGAELNPKKEKVLKALNDLNVTFVSVGIGGLVPSSIPAYNEKYELLGYREYEGSVALTSLGEPFLKELADGTNGYYLNLKDENDLVEITRSKNLDSQPILEESDANYVWIPIAISMFLFAIWLLSNIRK